MTRSRSRRDGGRQPGLQLRPRYLLRFEQSADQGDRDRLGEAAPRGRRPGGGHEGAHRLRKQVAGNRVARRGGGV